jgi:hypothetical protein
MAPFLDRLQIFFNIVLIRRRCWSYRIPIQYALLPCEGKRCRESGFPPSRLMNILESEWLLIQLVLGLLSAWGVYPYIYLFFSFHFYNWRFVGLSVLSIRWYPYKVPGFFLVFKRRLDYAIQLRLLVGQGVWCIRRMASGFSFSRHLLALRGTGSEGTAEAYYLGIWTHLSLGHDTQHGLLGEGVKGFWKYKLDAGLDLTLSTSSASTCRVLTFPPFFVHTYIYGRSTF